MSLNPIIETVKTELQHYPGVEMEFHNRGKHDRIVFSRGTTSRFLTVPKTPSDWRAGNNAMRDFRKTMRELGAQRERGPRSARIRRGFVANFQMNEKLVVLHIPKSSKLLKRFRTPNGKATGHWGFSLRSSPDLTAPPLLVVKRAEVQPGQKFQHGLVAGFNVSGAWRLTMGRNVFPALSDRIESLPNSGLTLYEDNGDELVFKLPPGTIPTGFSRPAAPQVEEVGEPGPLPSVAFRPLDVPLPVAPVAPVAPPYSPPAVLPDQPITLQLPKQGVSIEAAIAVLNKAKQRLGHNLRFTIEEGGFLSAVHKIGR